MNDNELFDDLARQKLEERRFPLDEAHLHDMEAMLAERGKNKRRGWIWSFTAIALLLAGIFVWTSRPDGMNTGADGEGMAITGLSAEDQTEARTEAFNVNEGEETTVDVHEAPGLNGTVPAEEVMSNAIPNDQRPSRASSGPDNKAQEYRPTATHSTITTPIDAEVHVKVSTQIKVDATTPSPSIETEGPGMDARGPLDRGADQLNAIADVDSIRHGDTRSEEGSSMPSNTLQAIAEVEPLVDHETAESPVAENGEKQEQQEEPRITEGTPDSLEHVPDPMVSNGRGLWEFSVLGGIGNTVHRYAGDRVRPEEDRTNARSMTVGMELMHMSDRFGWGLGLHYVTYAERITVEDQFARYTEYQTNYSLEPVNVTVIGITDTVVVNGQTYYTTTTIDTTLYFLHTELDTVQHEDLTLKGRSTTNILSYVEIPLLGDVHFRRAKWEFGIRGGPTFGLLSGKKGVSVNAEGNGYEDLRDRAFRSVVIGATVRGYIRYRIHPNWSVGLEPSYRMQLMNVYSDQDLDRRASVPGITLSANYRFR